MKITKHIPNAITSMNLLSGVLGIVFAFRGMPVAAFGLMLAASVFDYLDGFCARLLGAYSPMGKELDSLSDMVSFGVLPALMLYCYMDGLSLGPWCWISLSVAVFSGLRLAKFNIDDRQSDNFIGMPTPSVAIICGSLACLASCKPDSFVAHWCQTIWFVPAVSLLLSSLLVCEVPFFAMKIKKGGLKEDRFHFLKLAFFVVIAITVPTVLLTGIHFSAGILVVFFFYILESLLAFVFRRG
ncbi:MAG: CDP-diacylglycerol--serine O-phosphatidyltransferase [Bacteroidales bacterium]|nr:CDP-diacylglycerol--serine O-phosphatidyltransferase [Bacteroidales bacterium]